MYHISELRNITGNKNKELFNIHKTNVFVVGILRMETHGCRSHKYL